MEWLRTHLYLVSLIGAFLAIGIGALIVWNRSDVTPQASGFRAWGGVGTNLFDPTGVRAPQQPLSQQDNLYTQVKSGPPFYYAPATNQLPLTSAPYGEGDFDFDTFITLLSDAGKSSAGANMGDTGLDIYSFIPQGLISTATPQRKMTASQRALYDYGNEAGSYIQSYEERYRSAPQILKDQFEDRQDPEKNAALRALARALEDLGSQLAAIETPSEIRSTHDKIAKSYIELGTKLALVSEARTDKAVLDAMLAYNASVETFVHNYVALATLLSAHGVIFSPSDAGSVFTFTAASF